MKPVRSQVTVFISLVMMCVFSFFCVLLESARTAGARWYLQMAADSALDSVFSRYHRELWDSYRLLFAEYEDEEALAADFQLLMQPYLDTENWYPMEYESASVEEIFRATEEDGLYFEKEILDYMKYGIWNMDFDEKTAESLWDTAKEATAVKEVAGTYRAHAKEALKLEKSLEKISESLAEQLRRKQAGLSELHDYDGPGFRRSAQSLIRELERIPGLVQTYQKRADELAAGLAKSRTTYEQKRQECQGQVQELLESEVQEYEAYVAADGERRQEVEALSPKSQEQIRMVEAVIEEAEEVERIIEEWEEDEEDEEGGDGPDLEALWRPVIRHFSQLEISPMSFVHGVKDKEKEGWLNQVGALYQSGLLELVVPAEATISERTANRAQVPSETEMLLVGSRGIGFLDHLLVDEYSGDFFGNFCAAERGAGGGDAGAGSQRPERTVLQYEVEYLLGGESGDRDNLSSVVHQLLAVREGLNMVHILSDAAKRAQARTLAMTITGLASATPLLLVTTFFVMSVWALGEALMDVRGLLAGKRVPLLKTAEDWTLGIDALLEAGKNRRVETGGSERGLDYLAWLKILLFRMPIVQQEYRMMDLMQINLGLGQQDFQMRNGVYKVKLRGKLCGKHVFFSLGFVENLLGKDAHTYPMEVSAERIY
ncbi:MAG: DUF5702 domain-containing protein [Lachnospiraceae bacterium]|nr:DUF5702 domain-containing protein [Lachnospiraceae bacterium]